MSESKNLKKYFPTIPENSIRPKKSELLMPAGSLANMKTAIIYGADALYAGTPDMSLRTKSAFSLEELKEGIKFAHSKGVRVYLTLNLYAHNKDIKKLPEFIKTIKEVKPDGVIIADPAVFQLVKEQAPELELHVSTQANITSWAGVKFWESQGAKLCVLAREVSFQELEEIREKCPNIKLEAFVHGAMCMTYSGRCLLSNFMAERGANQGNCAQSCRWKYKVHIRTRDGRTEEVIIDEENRKNFEFLLEEQTRPGEMMAIEEDEYGSYIMNSKDLCLMPKLNDYLRIGIDSLKVEGRHKNEYYVASVTRSYRQAIDDYYADPENWDSKEYMKELETIRNRGYTLAFHEGRLSNHAHDYNTTASMGEWSFGGIIRKIEVFEGEETIVMELRNHLREGSVLEFLPPKTLYAIRLRLYDFTIYGKEHKGTVKKVSAGQGQAIRIPLSAFHAEDKEHLKELMVEGTVVRTETLDDAKGETSHIKVRIQSHKMEEGKLSEKVYQQTKEKALKRKNAVDFKETSKPKKSKEEACCGRGCNGCLVFWHAPEYEKARKILATKKMGERLKSKGLQNND